MKKSASVHTILLTLVKCLSSCNFSDSVLHFLWGIALLQASPRTNYDITHRTFHILFNISPFPFFQELKIPLLKVAAPELVAGVSGESEQRIRDLFEQAVAIAPCILFLDEIDAVAPHRATAQKEMERRIVSQLLSCLDGTDSIHFIASRIIFVVVFFLKVARS